MDRMGNKIERLNHLLHTTNPDLVVLTEHGLKHEMIKQARLTNYTLVSAYGRKERIKGGVAIYKRTKLSNKTQSLDVEDYSSEMICEVSAVRITIDSQRCLCILGVYRPPGADLDTTLQVLTDVLDKLPTQKDYIVITGDINIDSLEEGSKENTALNELLTAYNIKRLSLPPTRITLNTVSSIDVVCTNIDRNMVNVVVSHTGISDHTGQYCTLDIPKRLEKPNYTSRRHLNQNNILKLKNLLSLETWEAVLGTNDVDEAYAHFNRSLTAALNSTCPKIRSRVARSKGKTMAYNEEVMALREEFLQAQDEYLLTGSRGDKEAAVGKKKAYDQRLRQTRREASAAHIDQASNKSKAVWELINSERRGKKEPETAMINITHQGEQITDAVRIANCFNTYFANIAEKTLRKNNINNSLGTYIHSGEAESILATLRLATADEIQKNIRSLKSTSSAGVDELSSKILKACEAELLLPLLEITNLSLAQGIFPSKLKTAKIYPKHKQGDTHDTANYRPISLLPTVSKLIEKIVLSRLLEYLRQNRLLTEKQHGFIPGKSTITAIIDLVECVITNLEAGNTITSIYLDLSKAFDCLGHGLILTKLQNLGIQQTALKWFASYLKDRTQTVEMKQTTNGLTRAVQSAPLPMNRGVPQGSVLGPVLFVLFTNDFPRYLETYSNMVMYADDTVLITANKNVEQLEVDTYIAVNMAQQYCAKNDLVLNECKTKQMSLGSRKAIVSEMPNLLVTDKIKHLGVILDEKMSWNSHIDGLCLRLSTALFALKRTKAISTPEATRTAYYALFESHLRYGITVWGGSSEGNLHRVLVLQKKAIRIMAGLGPRDTCRDIFRNWNILTVTSIYILETVLYCITTGLPKNRDIHGHLTRYAGNYTLPIHRSAIAEKKPSYAGMKMFNTLPEEMKDENPARMKKSLRSWLQERTIYTLQEFFSRRDQPLL